VQYQESDYAFVKRILGEEGIGWYFQHARDPSMTEDTMVLVDAVAKYPALDPVPVLRLSSRAADNAVASRNALVRFERSHAVGTNYVLLKDYDFRKPLLDLGSMAGYRPTLYDMTYAANELNEWGGRLEIYEHRSDYLAPEVTAHVRGAGHVACGRLWRRGRGQRPRRWRGGSVSRVEFVGRHERLRGRLRSRHDGRLELGLLGERDAVRLGVAHPVDGGFLLGEAQPGLGEDAREEHGDVRPLAPRNTAELLAPDRIQRLPARLIEPEAIEHRTPLLGGEVANVREDRREALHGHGAAPLAGVVRRLAHRSPLRPAAP
jgi:hypothetical protein